MAGWYTAWNDEVEQRHQVSSQAARARKRINGSKRNAESISKAGIVNEKEMNRQRNEQATKNAKSISRSGVVNAPEAKKETKARIRKAFGKSER